MDRKTVLRNLVTNRYMSDFDYTGTEFSFQTVFYVESRFSYCICACGFEHEYLDYISESGDIDEEVYKKVEHSILNGKCPHVDQVPKEYVRETKIFGIHIAAAVGTEKAFTDSLYQLPDRYGNLFYLDTYMIAMMKRHRDDVIMSIMRKRYRTDSHYQLKLVTAERSNKDRNMIVLKEKAPLEFLAEQENDILIKSFLLNNDDFLTLHTNAVEVLKLCNKYNLKDVQEILIQNGSDFEYEELESCLVNSIILGEIHVLDKLLSVCSGNNIMRMTNRLSETCHVFQRSNCKDLLEKYGCYKDQSNITTAEQAQILLNSLITCDNNLMDVIIAALKEIPCLSEIINDLKEDDSHWNCLYNFNSVLGGVIKKDPHMLKQIFELGADVNSSYPSGLTPFTDFIKTLGQCFEEEADNKYIRQIAELYIYENPDIESNKAAAKYATEADEMFYECEENETAADLDFPLTGEYLLDGQEHALLGQSNSEGIFLNFIVPLLLECGFASPKIFSETLEYTCRFLHPGEQVYIQNFLEKPRSLKWSCRKALRKYYKGRSIHKFVERSAVPQSLKDYILLKPLLKCIPKYIY